MVFKNLLSVKVDSFEEFVRFVNEEKNPLVKIKTYMEPVSGLTACNGSIGLYGGIVKLKLTNKIRAPMFEEIVRVELIDTCQDNKKDELLFIKSINIISDIIEKLKYQKPNIETQLFFGNSIITKEELERLKKITKEKEVLLSQESNQ